MLDNTKDVYLSGDQFVVLAKEIAETALLQFDTTRITLDILALFKKYQKIAPPQQEKETPSATAISYGMIAYIQQLEIYDRTLEAIISAAQDVIHNIELIHVAKGNEDMYRIAGKPIYKLTRTIERILEMVCGDYHRWQRGSTIDNLAGCKLTTCPIQDYHKLDSQTYRQYLTHLDLSSSPDNEFVECHPNFDYCGLDKYPELNKNVAQCSTKEEENGPKERGSDV